ncbi:MAG: Lacal_2735 family protein [Flavobacteriales bacterium]|nr:Lacal_2735 family protein [Flavobacteriales bacterium]
MFFKKDPIKQLEKEYAKKMEESHRFGKEGNRMKSDMAFAEAEEILNKIAALKNADKTIR